MTTTVVIEGMKTRRNQQKNQDSNIYGYIWYPLLNEKKRKTREGGINIIGECADITYLCKYCDETIHILIINNSNSKQIKEEEEEDEEVNVK